MKHKKFLLALAASLAMMHGTYAQETEISAQNIVLAIKNNTLTANDTVVYEGATYKVIECYTKTNANPEALSTPRTEETAEEYYYVTCKLEKPTLWAGIEVGTDTVEIRAEEGVEPLYPLKKIKNTGAVNNRIHRININTYTRYNHTYYKLQSIREYLYITGFTGSALAAYTITTVGLSSYLRGK